MVMFSWPGLVYCLVEFSRVSVCNAAFWDVWGEGCSCIHTLTWIRMPSSTNTQFPRVTWCSGTQERKHKVLPAGFPWIPPFPSSLGYVLRQVYYTYTHTHGVGSTFKGFSLLVIDVYSFDHMYCILKMKHFVENPIFGFFLKLRESQRKTKWKRYECRLRDVALGLQIRRWRGLDIWRAVLEEKWKAGLRGIWSQKAQWSNVLTSDGYQQSTRTGKWGRKGRWERGWMPSLLRH